MNYDYISPSVTKLLGYSESEIKNINFRSLILKTRIISDGFKNIDCYENLEKCRQQGDVGKWQADYLVRTKDGSKIWVTDTSFPWIEKGKVIGSIGTLRDISNRVNAEELSKKEIANSSKLDPLTGLYNRTAFFDELSDKIDDVCKNDNSDFSFMLIDVDNFKEINDQYGYEIGDKVLIELAGLIKSCLRDTDIAYRLCGEEFGILLPNTEENGAYWIADRMSNLINKHNFIVNSCSRAIKCSVSIGISSTEENHDSNAEELLKIADTRLFIAKNSQKNHGKLSNEELIYLN